MKGNSEVIDALNMLLTGELTAMDQYLCHSKMYEDWGLSKLHERIAHEFDDEKESGRSINFVFEKLPSGTHKVMAQIV